MRGRIDSGEIYGHIQTFKNCTVTLDCKASLSYPRIFAAFKYGYSCCSLFFHREDTKPDPQPTHKVAVHIPSQQNFDSDSEIEEVKKSLSFMAVKEEKKSIRRCLLVFPATTSLYIYIFLRLTSVSCFLFSIDCFADSEFPVNPGSFQSFVEANG